MPLRRPPGRLPRGPWRETRWFFVASSKQAKQNCCEASDDVGLRSRELSYKRSDSILVDPASSHMLVSKIKPCMSQHMSALDSAANGSLEQISFM